MAEHESPHDKLICGTSPHFWNKENRAPYKRYCEKHTHIARHPGPDIEIPDAPAVYDECWAFSRFKATKLTAAQFTDRILSGLAWIPSTFGGNGRRTNENWKRAELIAVDYDDNVSVADCLAVPFIRQHALLVHPSARSGILGDDGKPIYKTRVIFRFDRPITDTLETYRLAVIALCRLLGLPDDACSYKPAQLFYGSTNQIEKAHINLGALLPMALIEVQVAQLHAERAAQQAELERERAGRHYQPIGKDSDKAQRSIEGALKHAYDKTVGALSDRTTVAHGQARWLAKFLMYWPVTENDIEQTLLDALSANGAEQKYGRAECLRHIRNGISAGKQDAAEPLEAPTRKVERQSQPMIPISPINQYHDSADYTINVPLIDALPVESAALQSGVGTFKTGFATREMGRSAGKAWYVTHREKLAEQETERAQKDGVIIELYNELPKSELYRASRLSACINTLVLYVKETGNMPSAPDLLVIDEWSQFAESILIGGTLEGDELHIADQLVRYLLGNAKRVLLMDAHFSKASLDYARSARPGLPLVVNTYKTPRGELYIVEKRERAEAVAGIAAMAGERVAFGSFGIDRGQANADQLADMIGDPERVIFIHADNAGGERQALWLKDPDGQSKKYQAQVYSPLVGTGYSIDTPIHTLVVLASQQQSAEDVRQFIGRFRNVQKTYVWMPNAQDVRETDAQAIADRLISAAEQTAHPFIQDGRLQRSISPQARTYATHHAAIRAERNASMNDLRQRFVELCAGSYTIQALSGDDPAARALMNARLADIDQRRKALSLTAPSVDYEAFKQKQDAGQVSELDHAGHRRWQIEHLTGLTISETLRDRLWTEGKRKAANRYADLLDEVTVLHLADLEQAQNDTPLHKRQHRTPRRAITEAFLRPLIGADGKPIEYSAADLETVFRPIIEAHADNLHKYFGWYRYRVNTAAGVIRLVLRRVGLSFNTDRRRVDGERVQFYHLDADILRAAVETARAIVAQRRAERDEEYEAQVTGVQKLQKTLSLGGFAISGQRQKPKPMPAIEPGATGWAARPQEFAARIAALTAPVGMGY